jgi:hypothetical protein
MLFYAWKIGNFSYILELCIVAHYQWIWNYEKNGLILWKLISIWLKILNNIACNLNWIELGFNWTKLKFLNSIQIQLKKNKMQIGALWKIMKWHMWICLFISMSMNWWKEWSGQTWNVFIYNVFIIVKFMILLLNPIHVSPIVVPIIIAIGILG